MNFDFQNCILIFFGDLCIEFNLYYGHVIVITFSGISEVQHIFYTPKILSMMSVGVQKYTGKTAYVFFIQ